MSAPASPPAGLPGTQRASRRQHLVPVLIAIVCAVLAGLVMRLSEAPYDFDASAAIVGEPADLNGGTVTITAVRAGTAITDGDTVLTSGGMFVVVDLTARAGDERLSIGMAQLTSAGPGEPRLYKPFRSVSVGVDPGFEVSSSVVFEVDPAQIDRLRVMLYQSEVLQGYQQRVLADLGIVARNADQWRASARGRTLEVDEYADDPVPVR